MEKANKIAGMIKRNFNFLDKFTFNNLYKALVRPLLEYGHSIWSPWLIQQSKVIENVQRRATKLVPELRNLSYGERLRNLNLPSLKYRRLRGDLIEVYNILKEDANGNNKFFKISNITQTRGHSKKLIMQHSNTTIRKNSFSNRVITNWNNLPNFVVNATDTNRFKNLLDEALKHLMFQID